MRFGGTCAVARISCCPWRPRSEKLGAVVCSCREVSIRYRIEIVEGAAEYAQPVALGDQLHFLYERQGGRRRQLECADVGRQVRDGSDGLLSQVLEPLSADARVQEQGGDEQTGQDQQDSTLGHACITSPVHQQHDAGCDGDGDDGARDIDAGRVCIDAGSTRYGICRGCIGGSGGGGTV